MDTKLLIRQYRLRTLLLIVASAGPTIIYFQTDNAGWFHEKGPSILQQEIQRICVTPASEHFLSGDRVDVYQSATARKPLLTHGVVAAVGERISHPRDVHALFVDEKKMNVLLKNGLQQSYDHRRSPMSSNRQHSPT